MKKLQVMIEDEDYEMLKQVAKHERLAHSSWARRIITQALRRASRSLPDEGGRE